ncbi:MAG TPA: hypothetical protein PLM93_11140 [Sulfuricurvum sp.]|nr:MAG: hypothetical protein B7X89_12065 [Sulfuricurvum sp. 17-40-25]HQS67727.1 hypothetical protein [Sulfuricurvum sp.]
MVATSNTYTNPTLGLYNQPQFIGADGKIGTTVYKYFESAVYSGLAVMIQQGLNEVEFHTQASDGVWVNKYGIIRSGNIYRIIKKSRQYEKMYVATVLIRENLKAGAFDVNSLHKGKIIKTPKGRFKMRMFRFPLPW